MADVTDALDDGSTLAALVGRYTPLLLELAYADAEDTLGVDIAFDLANPRVQDVLGRLANLVQGVADTTKDDIRRLTGQAAAEGWAPARLAQAIRDAGVTESRSRSELIARTEAARAYTQGALLAYTDSGVVQGTTWITSDPCPICAPLDEHTAPLGERFPGGFDGPPAHPNCRCSLVPVVTGA